MKRPVQSTQMGISISQIYFYTFFLFIIIQNVLLQNINELARPMDLTCYPRWEHVCSLSNLTYNALIFFASFLHWASFILKLI